MCHKLGACLTSECVQVLGAKDKSDDFSSHPVVTSCVSGYNGGGREVLVGVSVNMSEESRTTGVGVERQA